MSDRRSETGALINGEAHEHELEIALGFVSPPLSSRH